MVFTSFHREYSYIATVVVEIGYTGCMAPETGAHLDARLDELLDVSLARGQALAHVLLAAGDMRMRELARRLGLATSTVTRLVDRLEAAGLAERRKERPDRRSVLVG